MPYEQMHLPFLAERKENVEEHWVEYENNSDQCQKGEGGKVIVQTLKDCWV